MTHILMNGAEASRIAAAAGRADFLVCSSPEARVRLSAFLAEKVTPVAGGPSWTVGVLAER